MQGGCMLLVLFASFVGFVLCGPFTWMYGETPDNFDLIMKKIDMVNQDNCKALPESMLKLPNATLAQLPKANRLRSSLIFANRTNLLHMHNMALYRAFFYSYVFYRLNETYNAASQPGLMYYYMSNTADVAANDYQINGSAIFFDHNTSFPNWWKDIGFNKTMPLFGPRAFRQDDTTDPQNIVREPTNNTIKCLDYGTGYGRNYSLPSFKLNDWYRMYLPDNDATKDSLLKTTYTVGLKYSDRPGHFASEGFKGFSFFGPPDVSQEDVTNPNQKMPVLYTAPYFDCGHSNKWIVSATAPVVDKLHRYHKWHHIRRNTWTAVVTMDIDFLKIDINQCDIGINNLPPNYFAGTHRCKPNTVCIPVPHFGFQRGGYECHCRQGYRYPSWVKGPYQGIDIERATQEEYNEGFDCLSVLRMRVENAIEDKCDASVVGRRRRDVSPSQHFVMHVAPRHHGVSPVRGTPETKPQSTVDGPPKPRRRPNESRKQELMRLLRDPYYRQNPLQANRLMRHLLKGEQKEPKHHLRAKTVQRVVKKKKQEKKLIPRQHSKPKKGPKRHLHARYTTKRSRRVRRAQFDQSGYNRVLDIFERKDSVDATNCKTKSYEELWLPGDVMHGAEKQFETYARLGVRLANFLSNFLQNVFANENYGTLIGDKLLSDHLLFGEVISLVMGDLTHYTVGSGIFFDEDKFINASGKMSSLFGPYAYRTGAGGKQFYAVDMAGDPQGYLNQEWFRLLKTRWKMNTFGLQRYQMKPYVRSDPDGLGLVRFDKYPQYYYAAEVKQGEWIGPYFRCDGYVNRWVITYAVPFFGVNPLRNALEFKGVVTVDMDLDKLDINQCPMEFHVPNAFKNTAVCDFRSTDCFFMEKNGFKMGGYKCECKQGYEMPIQGLKWWYFDGYLMEKEYRCRSLGQTNRYSLFRCRIAAASQAALSMTLLLAATLFSLFL